jgi:hypothetical protein
MCLDSVLKLEYPNFETVVVDNNSTDGSLELAKSLFSRFYFIKNEKNIGFAAGNNIGIRWTLEKMADYVLLLNNDAVIQKDALSILIEEAEKNGKAGILSPLIFKGNTQEVWFAGGKMKWLAMKNVHVNEQKSQDSYETQYITGCAMLIKKEVFQKIGLLDEDYFLYYEDADFCVRAKKSGFKILIAPSAEVYHYEKSEENREDKIYWLVLSGILFFRKNTPAILRPWMRIYLFLRKLKNRMDLRDEKNKEAKVVRKAYDDLEKFKK